MALEGGESVVHRRWSGLEAFSPRLTVLIRRFELRSQLQF
jgi:hypothetical protein